MRLLVKFPTFPSKPGVGKLFTRRATFGKTFEAAGRMLIGNLGEDLSFFWRSQGFHLVFHFNFAPLRLIFLKITAIRDLSKKKRPSA